MAYFIPSSIQKRLLRYALSRLEFLDTDALGLENLEIGWGRTSTVELKDIALRKDKLSSLLQLPNRLRIEDATVALLRLTVPSDLHTASITIEVRGVDVRSRLHEDEAPETSPSFVPPDTGRRSDRTLTGRRRAKSPPLRRQRLPEYHDYLGDDGSDVLPTTHDLAASFLAEEPKEEKAQLEAAMNSQSMDLRQSVASNDSGDDGLAYGTGIGLSLPTFLADFLKGIVDRLQVVVNGLSIKLAVNIDASLEEFSRPSDIGSLSETIVGLEVDTVKVYQAGDGPIEGNESTAPHGSDSKSFTDRTIRIGERCVVVHGISGSLISNAATFAQLSQVFDRAGDGGSPQETMNSGAAQDSKLADSDIFSSTSDTFHRDKPMPKIPEDSSYREKFSRFPATGLKHEEDFGQAIQNKLVLDENSEEDEFPAFQPSQGSSTPSVTADQNHKHSTDDRFSRLPGSPVSENSNTDALESSQSPSTITRSALDRFRERPSFPDLETREPFQENQDYPVSASFQDSNLPTSGMSGTFQQEPSLLDSHWSTENGAVDDRMSDSEGGISRISSDDQLAESRVFSHEEAESIYMSALNEASGEDTNDFRIPGRWDESEHLSGQSVAGMSSGARSRGPGPFSIPVQDSFSLSSSTNQPVVAMQNPAISKTERSYHEDTSRNVRTGKSSTGSTPSCPAEKVSVRPLCHISECLIWLPGPGTGITGASSPQQHSSSPEPLEDLNQSEYRTIPGAYSIYAESHASGRKGTRQVPQEDEMVPPPNRRRQTEVFPEAQGSWIELSLGSVKAKADAFTSRLLTHIVRKIQCTITPPSTAASREGQHPSGSDPNASSSTGLKFSLDSLEVSFVDSVGDSTSDPSPPPSANPNSQETSSERALFKFNLRGLSISSPNAKTMSSMRLEVGKLYFGFVDEDCISFSRETKLRTSLRDIREVRDKDLSLDINYVNGIREINLATQPVMITINLQKIDNTLGSIGGLSGLLELGSSIMSDTTVLSTTAKPPPRSRSVRFDSSTKPAAEQTHESQARVNIKVNGAYVSVNGSKCCVTCQSSAIKVVARSALIGLQIDDLKLSGPHIGHANDQAPLVVRLRDTRLKYLFAPEEHDLTRLISLLTPSKDKFEDQDDFLVETLIRQRKKGAVLRATLSKLSVDCKNVGAIDSFKDIGTEASKMSSVTKFLPKESRPGLLTLGIIDQISIQIQTGLKLGQIHAEFGSTEIAHITAPSLVAMAIGKIVVEDEGNKKLVTAVLTENCNLQQPMLMTRMIEDELEPLVKIKLWNICFEYSVPLLIALMNRDEGTTTGHDVAVDLAASIATLTEQPKFQRSDKRISHTSENSSSDSKALKLDLALRECAVGLTPRNMSSKALFVMTDARFFSGLPDTNGFKLLAELRKSSLLLTNDASKLFVEVEAQSDRRREASLTRYVSQIDNLCHQGYVCVTTISAASIALDMIGGVEDDPRSVDIEFKDKLFVLETCADSTQTLIETLNDLVPPTPPSKGEKYRTEVAPVEDMMASFTGDAFAITQQDSRQDTDLEDEDYYSSSLAGDFDGLGDIHNVDLDLLSVDVDEDLENDLTTDRDDLDEFSNRGHMPLKANDEGLTGGLITGQLEKESVSGGFAPGRLVPQIQGTANKWDSANNRYVPVKKSELSANPLKFRVRDTHIIWNLYDGYDWEHTRNTITKAVQDVETKAAERRQGKRTTLEDDEEDESVIGDFLFNSIYIGVPLNHDPKELSRHINRNIDDLVSETASQAPSHTSTATSRPASSQRTKSHGRKLKLNRSRRHKIAFELRGVSADFFVFTPGGETQSSTDVRIEDFEIFDHVPTSTWKKFATYMHDAGPREDNKPMLHLEICDVRPVPELTAAELVIRVTVLPLRLHVDQDALDFITRFFEFSDDNRAHTSTPAEQPYLQRVEVRPVPIKLDYKPKKIDYAGLRSGRTTEFMNFFILDGAEFILKHLVVYGTSGFLKLHKSLEDVWMPDVKNNQLPSVLSGLNGVRTFVNVGTGVRDLVAIPIQEYRKDGRIVRSISKGAMAFARTTGSELTRLGARMAIGAQTALQGAEGLFAQQQNQPPEAGWEEMDMDPEEKRTISHYANQPTGILQGLKGAARSLERDLLVTRDIIVAISGEVRDSSTAEGAALAVARHAPTLILRPMIGATKAISQTLLGATNTVDPQNRRRVEDKYKRY